MHPSLSRPVRSGNGPRVIGALLLLALLGGGAPRFGRAVRADTLVTCSVSEAHLSVGPIEQGLLREINQYRNEQALPPVTLSPTLTRAALWKSAARAEGGAEAHDDPFRSWHQRLLDCGYTADTAKGENLASFDGDLAAAMEPRAVLDAWKASPAHNRVLLTAEYLAIGLARVRPGGGFQTFWTADFGGVVDGEPAQ